MGAPEKRMMKFVIIALALAVASAVPEGTFVQENMLLENAEFASAHEKVTNMLQEDTQARRSACVKAADASINNVFRDVQNSQRLLNRMNNGRRCATRNQHLINRAKRTISTRTRQVHVATISAISVAPAFIGTSPSSPFVRVPASPSTALASGRVPSVVCTTRTGVSPLLVPTFVPLAITSRCRSATPSVCARPVAVLCSSLLLASSSLLSVPPPTA